MKSVTNTLIGTRALLSLIAMITIGGTFDVAAQAEHSKAVNPDTLKWGPAPPSLPKGAQAAVLSGDPGKPGPFTIRLKFPPGFKVPAHNHPTFEAVTLISGSVTIGMGDKLDESKGEKLAPGGFIYLAEKTNHFAIANTESIVQINSEGPFNVNYVNPADDPRKTQ
jgi:quercetin dioxygenase-like cupin family protein